MIYQGYKSYYDIAEDDNVAASQNSELATADRSSLSPSSPSASPAASSSAMDAAIQKQDADLTSKQESKIVAATATPKPVSKMKQVGNFLLRGAVALTATAAVCAMTDASAAQQNQFGLLVGGCFCYQGYKQFVEQPRRQATPPSNTHSP